MTMSKEFDLLDTATMPAIALRGLTVFPNVLIHFEVAREASVRALETARSPETGHRLPASRPPFWLHCARAAQARQSSAPPPPGRARSAAAGAGGPGPPPPPSPAHCPPASGESGGYWR